MVGLQSCDIILGGFSHKLLELHAMFTMRMGQYIGIPTNRVSVFKLGRVFACFPPTADVAATGDSTVYGDDQPGVQ